MKISVQYFYVILVAVFIAGCQKPGPIELVDHEAPPQSVQIDTSSVSPNIITQNPDDTLGLFSTNGSNAFGHITIAGVRFDSPLEHIEATMAQATFYDRSRPVIFRTGGRADTLYHTFDAGNISVNNLLLNKEQLRFRDTVLGPLYSLFNRNGLLGLGLVYLPRTTYQWQSTGSSGIPAFNILVRSTPKFRIDYPTPSDAIDPSKNLRVRWIGDSIQVGVMIRRVANPDHWTADDLLSKPLLKFRALSNAKEFVIPSSVLLLLKNQRTLIFTFIVESSRTTRIDGYHEDVLLTSSYSHHLLLRMKR